MGAEKDYGKVEGESLGILHGILEVCLGSWVVRVHITCNCPNKEFWNAKLAGFTFSKYVKEKGGMTGRAD